MVENFNIRRESLEWAKKDSLKPATFIDRLRDSETLWGIKEGILFLSCITTGLATPLAAGMWRSGSQDRTVALVAVISWCLILSCVVFPKFSRYPEIHDRENAGTRDW